MTGCKLQNKTGHLVLLLSLTTADLEVSQLVSALGGGDDVQEISQLLLLKILLGQVLKVSLGERKLGVDDDLGLVSGDGHLGTELTGLAVDLDSVVEELLERGRVQDLVLHRGGKVDGELGHGLLAGLLNLRLLLKQRQVKHVRTPPPQLNHTTSTCITHANSIRCPFSYSCFGLLDFTQGN